MKVLITGTSRGIGFALTLEALKKGHTVYAVSRSTENLAKVQRDFPKTLIPIQADVSSEHDIQTLATTVTKSGGLDVLINNAGIIKKDESATAFAESFHINATVPFLMTVAFVPVLEKSKEARVVQISTMMGSIEDNTSGGYYSYRSSKAALNMITRSLAIDYPQIRFALIHPGWVKTDMGGPEAPVEPIDSARGIWSVIEKMTPENTGAFVDYKGEALPW